MMNRLELKVPPGLLIVVTGVLMWLVSRLCSPCAFVFPARLPVAIGFALTGLVIASLGAVQFRRAGTTLNPLTPQSASGLVVSGIYSRTRNPMYLGFLFLLIGWAVLLSNGFSFLLLPVFVFYMNRFQIQPEERALLANFGEEFAAYKKAVRRWL